MNANHSALTWLIKEKLAKATLPDVSDLVVWQEAGIQSILNLLEEYYEDIVKDELRKGFKVLHSPVADFGAPSLEQLKEIVQWIDAEITTGRKVLVHCFAGIGRTGMVLIAYLLYKGDDMESATEKVLRVGARPQSSEQLSILQEFSSWVSEK